MMVYLFYPLFILAAFLSSIFINKNGYDRVMIFMIFIMITICSGTRYGVGSDYINYESIFYTLNGFCDLVKVDINRIYDLEPGYILLNKIFGFSTWGFYFVIFIMSFLTMVFVNAAISTLPNRYKYLAYFILVTNAFVFLMQNQMRQAVSIAIFLFSIRYINSGDKSKFFGINILSALFFHYSALIILPTYALRYISLSKKRMIFIIAIVLPASIGGVFNSILYGIVKNISVYNAYLSTSFSEVTKLSVVNIITVFYFFLLIFFFDRKSNESKILFWGLVLSCVFSNFSLLERLSSYFIYIKIIAMPIMIYGIKNRNNRYMVLASLIVYSVAMYINAIVINSGGNIPYMSLLERFV